MRKYLWLGAILSIAVALGVYWTARFAARHPESFFNNCWSAARLGMYLANPGMPPPSPVGTSTTAQTTPCNAVPCAHHTPEVGDVCQPRLPRTTAPAVAPQDPEEVIHIEQINPNVAQAIAEALEVPQILEHLKLVVPADQGPDELVLTILDGGEPVLVRNPTSQDAVHDTKSVGADARELMPYCYDSDEEFASILAAVIMEELGRPAASRAPERTGHNCRPGVEETTDLLMPYVDDESDETGDSQENGTNESGAVPNPDSTTQPEDLATPTQPEMNPAHHPEEEGCPYLNGHYCPRYSQPYSPPPPAQPETQVPQTQPMEQATEENEQQKEPPAPPGSQE